MPYPTHSSRRDRHLRILARLGQGPVRSQRELQRYLAAEGVAVNQATLSRDLRELGLVKDHSGYRLLPETAGRHANSDLHLALERFLLEVTPVQNQILLKTPPGGAQPLARALDLSPPADLLGTLAGDDTILLICSDQRRAKKLAKALSVRTRP